MTAQDLQREASLAEVRTARFVIEKHSEKVWNGGWKENNNWSKRYQTITQSLIRSGFTFTEFETVISEKLSRITITAGRARPEPARNATSYRVGNGTPVSVEQCAKGLAQAQQVYRSGIAQWKHAGGPAPDLEREYADVEYWTELQRLATERKAGKSLAVAA